MGARAKDENRILSRPRTWLALLALVLVAAALAFALLGRSARVETAVVARGDLVRTVVTSGRVEAPERTMLGAAVGGRVVAVSVEEGQHVERGELLVQIDDAAARDALAEAMAALEEAEARLRRERRTGLAVKLAAEARAHADVEAAEAHFERTERLVEEGALSANLLDEARRGRETAAAEVRRARAETESASAGGSDVRLLVATMRRAQAAVRSAERRLAETALRAPSAGTILERNVELGEVVSQGKGLLEFVADGDPRLEVHPDESHLAYMREGQSAVASVEARPRSIFTAKVDRIAPAVDAARGTVKVELTVEPPVPEFLMTGMTVSVEIELARRDDVRIVPAEAIEDVAGAVPYVLVVEDGRAVRREVNLGMRAGELFEVLEGLEEGERVVLGGSGVEAGARVRPAK
ncbi:MAG: efflux RND transporter periplasmic adaptor subunit, partial [Polyangiaceae bacterium]|nr:efflux RND transporter periplasmic adaptor subunit [Polyangiaceae bacterium]